MLKCQERLPQTVPSIRMVETNRIHSPGRNSNRQLKSIMRRDRFDCRCVRPVSGLFVTRTDKPLQRFDISPKNRHLLGSFTVFCLIMNRTIGSGIFTVPPKVLSGTGSVGGALMLWFASGIIVLCGMLCWLELGLTIPMYIIHENGVLKRVSAPRNGGEKNYVRCIILGSSQN